MNIQIRLTGHKQCTIAYQPQLLAYLNIFTCYS